ncbi:hypothetical protein EMGBD2_09760 [Nitrospirota bacterium]|nr:hypothetical protein EMGBD2_09760 [Nitrospirota bacterium]
MRCAMVAGLIDPLIVGEPGLLMVLSTMLSEAGAYHHGLRLARAKFRDQLERTGGSVSPALWPVAYPMGLLPTIKGQGRKASIPIWWRRSFERRASTIGGRCRGLERSA